MIPPASARLLHLLGRCVELFEVTAVAIRVDRARVRRGPRDLVPELRARGARRTRSQPGRAQLRRMIRVVDRCFPSGANCYRRALIEIAMDASAAAEPLRMGLKADGGPNTGHAWLESAPEQLDRYDAEFVV